MKSERRLTVELGDKSRVDEYRIHGGEVEFRAKCPDGADLPGWGGWRQLIADDISLNVALHTPSVNG